MKFSNIKKIPLILNERTASRLLFPLFIAAASFFIGKAIVDVNIRIAIITVLMFVIGVCCLRIQTGVFALLLYLPFMAFLRRYIYVYNPYVSFDPILIISSIFTIFMFLYLVVFHLNTIVGSFKEKPVIRFVNLLFIWFFLEMLNPIQGGLTVGITGSLFFIIPIIWFYFGRFIDKKRLNRILYLTVFIGLIVALYGLKQNFLGYTTFEKYWVELGGYGALSIRGWLRPVSTFASSQEYTTYIMIAGIISFALATRNIKNLPLLAVLCVILYALIMSATRGALLGLILGMGIYTILGLKRPKIIALAFLVIIFVYIGLATKISIPYINVTTPEAAYLSHTTSGIFDPFAKGSTLWLHWKGIMQGFLMMFKYPVGHGLGASTLAAAKFGGEGVSGEGFMVSLFASTGIIGAMLFFTLLYFLLRNSFMRYVSNGDFFSKLIFVIAFEILLTIDLRLYSVGPLVWLLLGYQAYRS